jgi:hypothetical protein
MAAGDIFNALDPTKKRAQDPNAMADRYQGGAIGATLGGASPTPAPATLPAPAAPSGASTGGGDMNPQQAAAAGLGWVDKNNPNYGKAGYVGSAPAAPSGVPAPPAAAATAPAAPVAPAGGDALPAGASDMGNGLVRFADGQVLPRNHPAFAAKMAAAGPAAPAAPATPAPAAPVAGAPIAPAAPDTNSAFKDALMKLLTPGEVSADSPSLKPALDANHLAEQRSFESNRNMLAERAAANGTNGSGGFETGLTGLAEDRAQREGQFAGDAVTHAKDQQTASLLAALGIGGNFNAANADRAQKGDQFGKSLEEQRRAADIDAEMKRLGISSQTDLGNKDLSLRDKLGSGQLNLGLLSQLSNNSNFKDNLGATMGMHNQDAILKLLGMA